MASRNPDKKIKATAALDNSQKRSIKLDENSYVGTPEINGNETTMDLKFCSIYAQRGKHLLKTTFLIFLN